MTACVDSLDGTIHGHCGETSATDFVGTVGPTDAKDSAGGKVRQVLLPDSVSRSLLSLRGDAGRERLPTQTAGYKPNRGNAMRLKVNEIIVKRVTAFEALLLCGEAPTGFVPGSLSLPPKPEVL